MTKRTKNGLSVVLAAALVAQSGCGTIMHPERRGQKGGNVDAGVAILDGIGLLFFIIPGVIAFAVDFSNGTIYLPGGSRADGEIRRIRFDPRGDERAAVEKILRERTGRPVDLGRADVRTVALASDEELPALFASRAGD